MCATHRTCPGQSAGGCLHTLGDAEFVGLLRFVECSTMGFGGGVAAHQVISRPGAEAFFINCAAEGEGLAMFHR